MSQRRAWTIASMLLMVLALLRPGSAGIGEWIWEMPLATEYRTLLDTPYADLVNSATRDGSLIKSAVFIHEFTSRPWVHLDIAGTAWTTSDKATYARGAVGVATTTLVRLALDFANGEATA